MQLSSLVNRPSIILRSAPLSSPPPPSVKEDRRALFDAVDKADKDFENAKQVADAMLHARSLEIEKILLAYGKGPHMYKGRSSRIVKRQSEDGKRVIYFFRAVSKQDPEDNE